MGLSASPLIVIAATTTTVILSLALPNIFVPLLGGPIPSFEDVVGPITSSLCQAIAYLSSWNDTCTSQSYFEICLIILMLPGMLISISVDECNDDDDDINSNHLAIAARIKLWSMKHRSSSVRKDMDETSRKKLIWASSFADTDPRRQILKYFDDVAQEGVKKLQDGEEVTGEVESLLLKAFPKASVFSVWRPTSRDAIRKLMTGEGTGKGLDIKGKSSKHGAYSGNVPFLQIHEEEDKKRIRRLERDATLRIFYSQVCQREEAIDTLKDIADEMHRAVQDAKAILTDECAKEGIREQANMTLNKWDMEPISTSAFSGESLYISRIEAPRPGIQIPERLFWEAFVVRQDISRPPGSKYESGRPSLPAFQDMNFATMRKPVKSGYPRPVIFQMGAPLCPQSLVIAYEENNRVLPVVSDFDCFVVGTRNVQYSEPLPKDQIDVLVWMIDNIEQILSGMSASDSSRGWTSRWLDVLKESTINGFYPKIPDLGFGDPMSYLIMEHAVGRLQNNGAVRHGAESFNYYFPQELDDEFLVISDRLPGTVPWKYVNRAELLSLVADFVREGFTFPINPKWILCDRGWRPIFDMLLESTHATIKDSINVWYPPEVRERIRSISSRFPQGFQVAASNSDDRNASDVDMAEFELEHFITMNTKTLFEQIGGDATMNMAIDEFYDRVTTDPALSPFFEGINAARLKAHQRRFFKMAFTRIPASIDMDKWLLEKHARLFNDGLNEKHFDKVVAHLVGSLKHLNVPGEMIEEAEAIISPIRAVFAKGSKLSGFDRETPTASSALAAVPS